MASAPLGTYLGKIHVQQADPPLLTRCIDEINGVPTRGLLLRGSSASAVDYEAADAEYFYDLPPWVSLARSWDDLVGRTCIDFVLL